VSRPFCLQGQFDPFTIVLIGDSDVKKFQPGATIDDIGHIRPKGASKSKLGPAQGKTAEDAAMGKAAAAPSGSKADQAQRSTLSLKVSAAANISNQRAHGSHGGQFKPGARFTHSFHSLDQAQQSAPGAHYSSGGDLQRPGTGPTYREASMTSVSSSSSHNGTSRAAPRVGAFQARSANSLPQLSANGSIVSPRLPSSVLAHPLQGAASGAGVHPTNGQRAAHGEGYGAPPMHAHVDNGYYSPLVRGDAHLHRSNFHTHHNQPFLQAQHGATDMFAPHLQMLMQQRYSHGRHGSGLANEWAHLAPPGATTSQSWDRDRSFSSHESHGFQGGPPQSGAPPSHRGGSSGYFDPVSRGPTLSSGSRMESTWSANTEDASPTAHRLQRSAGGGTLSARTPHSSLPGGGHGIRGGVSPGKSSIQQSPLNIPDEMRRVGIAMAPPRHSQTGGVMVAPHAAPPLQKHAPPRRPSLEQQAAHALHVHTGAFDTGARHPPVRHQSLGAMVPPAHAQVGAPPFMTSPQAGARGIPLHPSHTRSRMHSTASAASSGSWGALGGNGSSASPAMRSNSNDTSLDGYQGGVLTKVGSFRSIASLTSDRGSEGGADTPSSRKRGRSSSEILEAPPTEFTVGHMAIASVSLGSIGSAAPPMLAERGPLDPASGLYVRLHEGEDGALSVAHVYTRDARGVESTLPPPDICPEAEAAVEAGGVGLIAAPGTESAELALEGGGRQDAAASMAHHQVQSSGGAVVSRGVAQSNIPPRPQLGTAGGAFAGVTL